MISRYPRWGRSGCHPRATRNRRYGITLEAVTRRNVAIDVGLTGIVLGLTLAMLAKGGFGAPGHGVHPLDGVGIALAVASVLPIAGCRFAPGIAYAISAVAATALLRLGYPLDVPLGPVITAYTLAVAYSGHPRPVTRWLAMLAVAAFVPAVVADYASAGVNITEIVPELLFWAMVLAGTWIAGDRTRLRRERIDELEEQARRADREAARERRLAAAEERIRIARELHDSAGHAINVILVQAGAARLLQDRDPAGSRRAIATVEEVARDTIGEIDRLVRALREDEPPGPADPAALEELVERHRASGLTIAAEVLGSRRALPRSVAWAAYRILQEALTNAARYGCGMAEVSVRFAADAMEITVTNPTARGDGPHERNGHGIVGMRERATLLGGTLKAGVEQGIFRLYARLPASAVGAEAAVVSGSDPAIHESVRP
jgi:signal transduction histidine kinase